MSPITLTREEENQIEQEVMNRFPKIPEERRCATERRLRKAARDSYRDKLVSKKLEEKYNAV